MGASSEAAYNAALASDGLPGQPLVNGAVELLQGAGMLTAYPRNEIGEMVGRLNPGDRPSAPDRPSREPLRFVQ